MLNYLIGLIGILVILGLAYVPSYDKKQVRFRPIWQLLILQFLLAYAMLNANVGQLLINFIVACFGQLLKFSSVGIDFVFGGLVNLNSFSFFFQVLMPIVFVSALIGILQYWKILGLIIRVLGFLLSKVNGMGRLESYNTVASAILGQSEVFISIKKQLPLLPEKRLFTLCTAAMSTVSASIIAAYMQLIEPRYVVTAVVLNLFGSCIIASLINPYQVDPVDDVLSIKEEPQSFFEMLAEYILDGFKIAVIVAAMLVGFIALLELINAIFIQLFGISFQTCLGYLFAPLAFLTGIPWRSAIAAGSIMATKLLSNEFVAMQDMKSCLDTARCVFDARSNAILSVFLVSFANFGSIGIICGCIKALDARQGNLAARFGFKLLYSASLVSFLSATVVGLVF